MRSYTSTSTEKGDIVDNEKLFVKYVKSSFRYIFIWILPILMVWILIIIGEIIDFDAKSPYLIAYWISAIGIFSAMCFVSIRISRFIYKEEQKSIFHKYL